VNHRAIQKDRMRKLVVPPCILAIDGDFIPIKAVIEAAVGSGMLRVGFQAKRQQPCKEMGLIPILHDPSVRESRQHPAARTRIIRGENRFPYRKDANM